MKRMVYLVMAALVALVILVPTAMAQGMEDTNMMQSGDMMMQKQDPNMMQGSDMMMQKQEPTMMQGSGMMQKSEMMPKTGGISLQTLLLPAAGLLLGTGLIAGFVFRRR